MGFFCDNGFGGCCLAYFNEKKHQSSGQIAVIGFESNWFVSEIITQIEYGRTAKL
jgi:hypothetical protein